MLTIMSKNRPLMDGNPKGYSSIGELRNEEGCVCVTGAVVQSGSRGGHMNKETYQEILTCIYFNDLSC